jgi:hypothetical protein
VARKSKPKLVDISRRSSAGTTLSVQIQPPPSWRRPSTPERAHEISAFSPDTPMELPDSGYVTPQPQRSDDCNDTVPSHGLTHSVYNEMSNAHRISFRSAFKDKPKSARACFNSPSSDESRSRQQLASPPLSPRQVDQDIIQKWWDYEWCLEQLESSVKQFPKSMLRLTSPVMIFLRQNHEKALLRPFRKIFGNAPETLLDYLCSALIARNYLVTMAATHQRSGPLTQANNLSRLDSVPEKARATLGISIPSASKFHIADQLLGSRSLELRKGLDRIVDKLIFSICGRADDTLRSSLIVLIQILESQS